jgi:hypothetical protein
MKLISAEVAGMHVCYGVTEAQAEEIDRRAAAYPGEILPEEERVKIIREVLSESEQEQEPDEEE